MLAKLVLIISLAYGPSGSAIRVDWSTSTSTITRSTSPSVLVAADPEWLPGAKMHDAAVEGVRKLADAGAD